MVENKKTKASSKPRKAATPEATTGEATTLKAPARKTATPKAAPKATSGELITMPSPNPTPTHEQIAALARNYWAERGYADGHHEDDWFRAEHELRAKAS